MGGDARRRPERAGRQSEPAGEYRSGADCARESEAGPVAIRVDRRGQQWTFWHGTLQAHDGDPNRPRAVQRRAAGADRFGRRTNAVDARLADPDDDLHSLRQAARARGEQRGAQQHPARTCRRSAKRACPVTRRRIGGAWRRRAARRRRSSIASIRKSRSCLQSPDTEKRFVNEGAEPQVKTPAELGKYVSDEMAKWRELARIAGIRGE